MCLALGNTCNGLEICSTLRSGDLLDLQHSIVSNPQIAQMGGVIVELDSKC